MFVIKRGGRKEKLLFDKITFRNAKLAKDLNINTEKLSQSIISELKDEMTTREIDELSCENAIHRSTYEPDYAILASRIAWNDLHKTTEDSFEKVLNILKNHIHTITNKPTPLINEETYNFAMENIQEIQKNLNYEKDYDFDYFAYKTLTRSYLQKCNNNIVERPQHMLMRVALGIHGPSKNHKGDIKKAMESYKEMSNKKFTHASPTLFNAGTCHSQMSSCFLLSCPDDLGGIFDCLKDCAMISKFAGGIGVDISARCKGSYIAGTNGRSNGIIPWTKLFNETARCVDQGGGKRKGAFAMYLQPWHPDIFEFLEVRLPTGPEEVRARDMFTAMWIPDLFFKRLLKNETWSLFCPGSYPELITLYGKEFEERYLELEKQKKYVRQVPVSKVFEKIADSLEQTGLPYMLSKDNVNYKNNQKNIGPITGSNLCCEITEYHNKDSVAVCNLASVALPKFVKEDGFDFTELGRIVGIITENMNKVIDKNFYPVESAKKNNYNYRPVGIGVQGLADVFAMLKLPWESKGARELNQMIFEVIYYHALKKSHELAMRDGSYDFFEGSPVSQGKLQFDMERRFIDGEMKNVPVIPKTSKENSFGYTLDWEELREKVKMGLRNSLLVAPMPTASTSRILGNNECFEPFTSNLYMRKVLSGNFPMLNRHLYKDLNELGLWKKEVVDKIVRDNGSVQNIEEIPEELRKIYKTNWELPQKVIVDMAIDRSAFIDQSQSLNISFERPSLSKMSSLYMYGWKNGLKTLSYYMRSKPAVEAVKFTLMEEKSVPLSKKKFICTDDVCVSCSG